MKKALSSIFIPLLLLSGCLPIYRTLNLAPSKKEKAVTFADEAPNTEYQFYYSDTTDNKYLRKLRINYGLAELTAYTKDDLEKIKVILDWTHNQWDHSSNNEPSKFDAITILEEAKNGHNFRCVEYGIVSSTALTSIGVKSRVLGLMTFDIEKTRFGAGHVVAESYSRELQKWVYIDGQYNTIPILDDIPLNAVEFKKAILEKDNKLSIVNAAGELPVEEREKYIDWIGKYLFYLDIGFDNRFIPVEEKSRLNDKPRLCLVPLDADVPTVFQRKRELEHLVYTHNVNDLYHKPN